MTLFEMFHAQAILRIEFFWSKSFGTLTLVMNQCKILRFLCQSVLRKYRFLSLREQPRFFFAIGMWQTDRKFTFLIGLSRIVATTTDLEHRERDHGEYCGITNYFK